LIPAFPRFVWLDFPLLPADVLRAIAVDSRVEGEEQIKRRHACAPPECSRLPADYIEDFFARRERERRPLGTDLLP
jgi:hypothetical protein